MTKPRHYQVEGINGIADFNGRALLADEMGLGKSYQSLGYAVLSKSFPLVVVCPASLKYNWQDECAMHFNLRSEVLEGRKAPRGKRLLKPPPVTIVNPDILPAWLPYLKRLKLKLVIGDEVHYFKNRKAQRTQAFKKLCKGIKKVVGLGGTPIKNKTADFWEMLHLLNPKVFDSRRSFLYRYCDPKPGYIGMEFKGATNTKELNKKLRKHVMIRRLKKNVLDELPPKSRIIVKLGIKRRSEYEAAENDFIKWLRAISPGKAWRASRAMQYTRTSYLMRLAAELKLHNVFEWLDNFLETTNKKILVVAVHKTMIKALQERYKGQCVAVHGGVTGRKRHAAVKQFQNDKKIRMIISQVEVAQGWNATAADTVAFVELHNVPVIMEQAIDRVHRMGQTKKVNAYFFVARDTIEERYVRKARETMERFNAVLDGGDVGEDYSAFDAVIKELRTKERSKRKAR
jgi:SWI/SNF-related matrix-associated actin-dependent regulator of chromatin subfamily A-like protein 1